MGPVVRVLFLFPLLLLASPGAQAQTGDAVLDSTGSPVRRGVQYWLVPPFFPAGGGLQMSRVNGSCPPYVTQLEGEVERGQPLMFFPEEEANGVVRVSVRNYVLFPRPTPCPQSTMWRADGEYVRTGGTAPLGDLDFSRFSIFKSRRGYVIRSCPCRICRMGCSDVVVNVVNGQRFLQVGTGDRPHEVVFMKATEEEEPANIILPVTMHP